MAEVERVQDPSKGREEEGVGMTASHSEPQRLSHRRENRPVIVCQPCLGKGHLHPWLGGFKGVIALMAAVGQAVALVVVWVAWMILVAMVTMAMEGVCVVQTSYSGFPLREEIAFQLYLHLLEGLQLLLVDVLGLQVA